MQSQNANLKRGNECPSDSLCGVWIWFCCMLKTWVSFCLVKLICQDTHTHNTTKLSHTSCLVLFYCQNRSCLWYRVQRCWWCFFLDWIPESSPPPLVCGINARRERGRMTRTNIAINNIHFLFQFNIFIEKMECILIFVLHVHRPRLCGYAAMQCDQKVTKLSTATNFDYLATIQNLVGTPAMIYG